MLQAKTTGGWLAAAALVVNAVIWGVSWWPFRELQNQGLHPLWATAAIHLVACMGMLLIYPIALKQLLINPQLWWVALAAGLTNVAFNWAVTVGDVVRVVLLFYLMPAWTVLAAWVMLGEQPTRSSMLRLLLAMTGVLLVLKLPNVPWPIPQSTADWLALAGGLCFAVTNVLLRKFNHTPGGARMIAMFLGGAVLAGAAAVLGLALQSIPSPTLAGTAIWAFLGLSVAFVVGNAAFQYGAARLAPTTTSLVMLTEILFASVSAALLGAADFSPRIFWGGSLIILAALLAALAHHKE